MALAKERLTLREFADKHDLRYLWVHSQTWPAGQDWKVQTGPDVPDEDYLESIEELPDWGRVADLSGTIDERGRWCWDGHGDPCDSSGGAIYSVVAGWTGPLGWPAIREAYARDQEQWNLFRHLRVPGPWEIERGDLVGWIVRQIADRVAKGVAAEHDLAHLPAEVRDAIQRAEPDEAAEDLRELADWLDSVANDIDSSQRAAEEAVEAASEDRLDEALALAEKAASYGAKYDLPLWSDLVEALQRTIRRSVPDSEGG